MAGRIRQEDVEAVRERSDIVQVVSQHLQLKKAGRDSLVGLCPFHPEKTPSFSVSPSKQVYYCFGCGEGGNVFRFLERVEGLSFAETVERLARDAGITLRYEGGRDGGREAGRRQAIHRAIAHAAELYHRVLLDGREGGEARAYLEGRGVTRESIARFQIGYAPGYPDFLLRRLARSFSPELLLESGLVARAADGAMRDRFRGRVMFPVHDLSGNAVGFGGRILERPHAAPNAPKYVNSPDGVVYHKGNLLYNLNRAKGEITRAGRAFLVEGYTDVIALDQSGIPTAVATCGTALGEDHVRLLARFTERAVLAFDSDEAGARAAERAFTFHQRYPVDLSVLILPQGQDPADFARGEGGEAFLRRAEEAVPLVEYMIDRTLAGRDLSGVEERARTVRAGLGLVVSLEDPVRRDEYARILAGKVGESETAVMLELHRMSAGSVGPAPQPQARSRVAPEEEVEAEVLKLLVQEPALCERWSGAVDVERFAKPTHRKAFELIREVAAGHGGPLTASALTARAQERPGGEALARLMAALALQPLRIVDEPIEEYAERLFLRLEEFSLRRRADGIRRELERLNPVKVPDEHEALFAQLVALEAERRRVRVRAEEVGSATSAPVRT